MYPLKHHPSLAERWSGFSKDRQILMIANELNRARNLLDEPGDPAESRNCLERAFELIDLTVEWSAGSLRYELLRLRECLGQTYLDLVDHEKGRDRAGSKTDLTRLFRALLAMNPQSYAALA